MKEFFNKLPIRWIFRLAIITIISIISGMSFWWCLLAYIGIMFLIRFLLNMLVIFVGFVWIIVVFLALFLGLLTL